MNCGMGECMTHSISGPVVRRPRYFLLFFQIFSLVLLLVTLLTVVVTFTSPESFASTARIRVEEDRTEVQSPPTAPGGYDPYFVQSTCEILTSELVLSNVIATLDLNVEWGKKYFSSETLKTAESLEILRQRIQITPVKNSELIMITVYSDERNEAAEIANAIVTCYIRYRNESLQGNLQDDLKAMQSRYQRQQEEIHDIQAELVRIMEAKETNGNAANLSREEMLLAQDQKWTLEQLLDVHKALFSKIEAAKLDLEMPRHVAQITDVAKPGFAPVKPNKTANIVMGVFGGAILGTVLGGIAVFSLRRSSNKNEGLLG